MKTHVSVPIHTSVFLDLVDFLRDQGSNRDPVVAVADAIDYWIQNTSWKQHDLMPEIFTTESRGYTWKYKDSCLFLPHDTEIRMPYKGQYHYAKVVGDEIKYKDAAITPGALANAVTSSSRNAWRDLWIKRPDEKEWTLADQLRRETKANSPTKSADEMLDELGNSK
jgi:hypothetical protein